MNKIPLIPLIAFGATSAAYVIYDNWKSLRQLFFDHKRVTNTSIDQLFGIQETTETRLNMLVARVNELNKVVTDTTYEALQKLVNIRSSTSTSSQIDIPRLMNMYIGIIHQLRTSPQQYKPHELWEMYLLLPNTKYKVQDNMVLNINRVSPEYQTSLVTFEPKTFWYTIKLIKNHEVLEKSLVVFNQILEDPSINPRWTDRSEIISRITEISHIIKPAILENYVTNEN